MDIPEKTGSTLADSSSQMRDLVGVALEMHDGIAWELH
jgi:hypothetical protein